MRAPLPTTDALFAQEVEQKMSNLLAGFGAVQSFLDRTKHRTATQLAAAETSPGTSKIAVGTLITERPPHRSEQAQFGHSAPTSGG
jgi:hypothetical protein